MVDPPPSSDVFILEPCRGAPPPPSLPSFYPSVPYPRHIPRSRHVSYLRLGLLRSPPLFLMSYLRGAHTLTLCDIFFVLSCFPLEIAVHSLGHPRSRRARQRPGGGMLVVEQRHVYRLARLIRERHQVRTWNMLTLCT